MKPILAFTTLAAAIAAAPSLHAVRSGRRKTRFRSPGAPDTVLHPPVQGTKDKWLDREDKYQKPSVRPWPKPKPQPDRPEWQGHSSISLTAAVRHGCSPGCLLPALLRVPFALRGSTAVRVDYVAGLGIR